MIRYHHGIDEEISYDNLTTPKSYFVYGENVGQAIIFPFRLLFDTEIPPKIATEQIANQNAGLWERLFFAIFHESVKFIE